MANNSYKQKAKTSKKKAVKINFLADRRFHLFIGFSLLLSSIFLLVSFISYLTHGQADQSVVEAYTSTNVRESGIEVKNAFGLIGAIVAHYFVFLWFGLGISDRDFGGFGVY